MHDIEINVITNMCLNKKIPFMWPSQLQPLSRERGYLCDKDMAGMDWPQPRHGWHGLAAAQTWVALIGCSLVMVGL